LGYVLGSIALIKPNSQEINKKFIQFVFLFPIIFFVAIILLILFYSKNDTAVYYTLQKNEEKVYEIIKKVYK